MGVIRAGNFVNPAVSGETEVRVIDGLKFGVIQETVTPDGSQAYDLSSQLPDGAVVISAQLKLDDDVSATTASAIGIGRKESTADPDKYLETSALTAGSYGGAQTSFSSADGNETLQVVATDGSGSADGSLDSGGDITARVVYQLAESL